MDKIPDIDSYVKRMEKSMMDKMFFIDKIFEPVEAILDFGCANGVLIKAMQQFFPEYRYIGYDISSEMIAKAKENAPQCDYYTDWDSIPLSPENTLINISSTVHEVYAYGDTQSVAQFWERVFHSGFKYIAIRDMMVSDNMKVYADPEDVKKARTLCPEKLAEYESHWGSITRRFDLIHYLLKYNYTENWDREVRENYLPISVESLLRMVPDNYEIVYSEHYTLPYKKQQVQKDCGIILEDATHFKLLLKRK